MYPVGNWQIFHLSNQPQQQQGDAYTNPTIPVVGVARHADACCYSGAAVGHFTVELRSLTSYVCAVQNARAATRRQPSTEQLPNADEWGVSLAPLTLGRASRAPCCAQTVEKPVKRRSSAKREWRARSGGGAHPAPIWPICAQIWAICGRRCGQVWEAATGLHIVMCMSTMMELHQDSLDLRIYM